MKNAKRWYSICLKRDFILHPSFDIWALEFGIFPLWAVVLVQQRPVFDFPCDYPVCLSHRGCLVLKEA
jgi:hypothetical protein